MIIKLFFGILRKLEVLFDKIHNYEQFIRNNVSYKNKPRIQGRIIIKNKGQIIIAKDLVVNNTSENNPVGLPHPTILATLNDQAKILIDEGVGISGASIVSASSITIGKRALIGGGVGIWDTDFHPLDYEVRKIDQTKEAISKPIIIGDDVFIGARAIILKGVTIGKGAIIGAGSVVTKDIEQHSIYAGNPAVKIKDLVKDKVLN